MAWQPYLRKPVYEIYWRLFQPRFHLSLREQRRIRALPLAEIRRLQWARLKQLLHYAFDTTDFYHQYFTGAHCTPADIRHPEDLLQLPLTDKQTYRTYFQQIIPRHVPRTGLVPSRTSGSSGEPFRFYVDPVTEAAHLSAAFVLNKEAMGIGPYEKIDELVLKVEPKNRIDLGSGAKSLRRGRLSCRQRWASEHIGISTNDITPAGIGTIARLIRDRKIQAFYGYPSSIFSLARYLARENSAPHLKYVLTIGEELLNQQRDYISTVFRCPVYRDYSASECMRMGFECACRNGYHMDIYNYYFEYLDGAGHARDDTIGEIVVTNLNNYVFPFLRYRIGDLAEPCRRVCRCGTHLPLVHTLCGRSSDLITTPTGRDLTMRSLNGLLGHWDRYLRQFQVVQAASDELLVRVVPTEQMNENTVVYIRDQIRALTDNSMTVRLVCVEEIERETTGKQRLLVPLRRP